MNIITRKEAKEKGLKYYFTGKLCKRGHVAERFMSNKACVECERKYYQDNSKTLKEYKRQYYQDNSKTLKEHSRRYYQTNREAQKKLVRNWQQKNSDKVNAFSAKRRASKLQRTPSWTNLEDIRMWYEVAEVLSRSGVKFHVDHVVPLQGKTVSGFHVENNMQVIPSYLNVSKNNQWNWEIQSHE